MKPIMNINEIILNNQLSQRTIISLCLGLAVLVFLTFTFTVRQWYDDWALTRQTSSQPVIASIAQTNDLITAIPNYHIFGKPINQMPVTNLHMNVTGIVKVSNQSGLVSKAYISIDGQASKIYKVGDDRQMASKLIRFLKMPLF